MPKHAERKPLVERVDEARKAVAGFLVPALLTLLAALRADSDMGMSISVAEWIETLVAALLTSGAVYAIGNGESKDPNTSTPDFPDGGEPTAYDLGEEPDDPGLHNTAVGNSTSNDAEFRARLTRVYHSSN